MVYGGGEAALFFLEAGEFWIKDVFWKTKMVNIVKLLQHKFSAWLYLEFWQSPYIEIKYELWYIQLNVWFL